MARMTDTMQVAVLHAAGAPFALEAVPRPRPGPGEVLVRIAASAVNPLDTKIRSGAADHARHELPAVLGLDMAGTVVDTGSGVSRFRVGDAVLGMVGGVGGHQGTLAEYVAVSADLLAAKPDAIGMREAAATPLAFITAWEGLVDRAGVAHGQSLLVLGGAGSVGQMAIRIARWHGAVVHATGSGSSRTVIEAADATFIDRDAPIVDAVERLTGGRGFDLVYDTVGGAVLDQAFAAVRRFGHVVSCLGWGTHSLAPLSFRAATYSGVFTLLPLLTGEGQAHHGAIIGDAARMMAAGHLVPRVDPRRFTLATVADAYASVTDGRANGKIVVDVEGAPAPQ